MKTQPDITKPKASSLKKPSAVALAVFALTATVATATNASAAQSLRCAPNPYVLLAGVKCGPPIVSTPTSHSIRAGRHVASKAQRRRAVNPYARTRRLIDTVPCRRDSCGTLLV